MKQLRIVVSSTRPGRIGPKVAEWVAAQAPATEWEVELLDLSSLPFFDEEDMPRNGNYAKPHTKDWASKVFESDAIVVVTPQYNRSFPASLKHLIDWHYTQWRAKPVGFVSYGGLSGGLRAVEQLRQVFAELHATTIRDTVSFHNVWQHIGEDGSLRMPDAAVPAKVMLEKLQWWAAALKDARVRRPYAA